MAAGGEGNQKDQRTALARGDHPRGGQDPKSGSGQRSEGGRPKRCFLSPRPHLSSRGKN